MTSNQNRCAHDGCDLDAEWSGRCRPHYEEEFGHPLDPGAPPIAELDEEFVAALVAANTPKPTTKRHLVPRGAEIAHLEEKYAINAAVARPHSEEQDLATRPCVICRGTGKVSRPTFVGGNRERDCRYCKGTGLAPEDEGDTIERLRAEVEKLTKERDEARAHIAKLVEIVDEGKPCNDDCDFVAIFGWVDPADRERTRGMKLKILAEVEKLRAELAAIDTAAEAYGLFRPRTSVDEEFEPAHETALGRLHAAIRAAHTSQRHRESQT